MFVPFIRRGPLGMVFEHLQNSFNLKDLASVFIQLHLGFHVVAGYIPWFTVEILGAIRLFLALAKPLSGVRPIVVGKAFYWFMSRALCLQFRDALSSHLSPH